MDQDQYLSVCTVLFWPLAEDRGGSGGGDCMRKRGSLAVFNSVLEAVLGSMVWNRA